MKRFRATRSSTRSRKGSSTLSNLASPDNNVAELETIELTGGYQMKVIDIPQFQEPSAGGKLEKETWSTQYHFILAALGYAVGLGNLWRFPYKMFQHGGVTFLIPYFLVLLFLGIPTFFMELVLGQYANYGPIKIFGRLAPIFKGLGYSMVAMISCMTVYYNMINSWSIFYFASAFQSQIPWEDTNQAEDYFYKTVLQRNVEQNKWDNFGPIHWELALCCLASWIIVFVVIWRGVHQSRLIVMFTSLFPFFCLLALCIIGFTLPGSINGLELLWKFDVQEFLKPLVCIVFNIHHLFVLVVYIFSLLKQLWKDAAIQVIFSLGLLCGSLSNLARYNDFRTNCFRDTLLIVGGDVLFSLLSGLTVFLFLGFIAEQDGKDVKDLVEEGIEGPTLTFITLMEGMTQMTKKQFPVPQLMVSMFSLLLLTLGLHSVYIDVETIQSALFDQFKVLRRKKVITTLLICVVFFLLSLPYCTSGGIYLFLLMDNSVVSNNAIILGIFEVLIVGWALGMERFFDHVSKMGMVFKKGTLLVGKLSLKFICPLAGFAILGFSIYGYFDNYSKNLTEMSFRTNDFVAGFDCKNGTTTHDANCHYVLPFEAEILSWFIQCFIVSFIPVFGVLAILKKLKTGSSWKNLVQPTENWRPAGEEEPVTFL